jgi:hypothetical protein
MLRLRFRGAEDLLQLSDDLLDQLGVEVDA